MDREILLVVETFDLWKGNSFTLAALVAEKQKELDRAKLEAAGHSEAAEAI